ncbi:hypothetical protein [Sulfitobacter sp. R18_1]|uniref:hypothetical protein n=1 Tax=Sulfitobacter sp. R18_1 TaxID=2821104 RepID=UPI001ADB5167|nr:hypothetical protein [Sulfitobacter sp. R18_1]MBO9427976.1 hypothetical protein [Sulfitobacter sp. R18_1]
MGQRAKQYHLQGLRSRFVGDDHILVAANSFDEASRLVKGAVSAALWHDWNSALRCQAGGVVTKIDLRKKKELTEADQHEVRAALGITDAIPAPKGENPVKALYRYMRQAENIPGRRILVICPLTAFTVDNTSLSLMLALGKQQGVRFVFELTPNVRVANKRDLCSIVSGCGVQVLGHDLSIMIGERASEMGAQMIVNKRPHCVFTSEAKMSHDAEKKSYFSKLWRALNGSRDDASEAAAA